MAKEQNVDMIIFGTRISLLTDEPEAMSKLALDLNKELNAIAAQYPGQKNELILTLALLEYFETNKKLRADVANISKERERLNSQLQSFLTHIDH